MRINKKVIISGMPYTIKRGGEGGSFGWYKRRITISKAYKKERLLQYLLHEICEAILVERNLRYELSLNPRENGNMLFVMNHTQFDDFVGDICSALCSVGLIKVKK